MALFWTILIFLLTTAGKFLMEEFNLGEVYSAKADEYTRTALGHEIHSLIRRLQRWSLAFSVFGTVDRFWLPWLDIKKVVFGEGLQWRKVDPMLRAAVALGWFLTLYAFLSSFSSGI